jgi:cell division protein FtsB
MARQRRSEPRVPVAISQGKLLAKSLRLNSTWVSVIAIVVIGGFLISPDVEAFLNQRRQIAEMEESIRLAQEQVEQMQAERDRWQDPVYIRSQARDRLYYVLPGEVSYLVMDASGMDFSDTSGTVGAILAERRSADEISTEIAAANDNWVNSLLESFLRAATDQPTEVDK